MSFSTKWSQCLFHKIVIHCVKYSEQYLEHTQNVKYLEPGLTQPVLVTGSITIPILHMGKRRHKEIL